MVTLFISYSHSDGELLKELEKHLIGLRRQGIVSSWHDRRIGPGEEIHGKISAYLDAADIILLLVSADFIASDYCYDIEMTRAMDRHGQGAARVIPVILRPCDWKQMPFGRLMACPTDGKPVVKHTSLDDGFLEVAQAVRQVAAVLQDSDTPQGDSLDSDKSNLPKVTHDNPRSSNLRIKRRFTDRERHIFINEAFEYISRYFENSLQEMRVRNSDIATDFRRVDANCFEAIAFISGQEQSRCSIWLERMLGTDQVCFSFDVNTNRRSYNETISVIDDGDTLFLEPMGMAHFGQVQGKKLNFEQVAEYFWTLFVQQLR